MKYCWDVLRSTSDPASNNKDIIGGGSTGRARRGQRIREKKKKKKKKKKDEKNLVDPLLFLGHETGSTLKESHTLWVLVWF